MKFASCLVALAAIPAAVAFAPIAPQSAGSALRSSLPDNEIVGNKVVTGRSTPPSSRGGQRPAPFSTPEAVEKALTKDAWMGLTPVQVQGNSLKTWSFSQANIERVQVLLRTEGRPLNANIDLWQGPDNAPQKISLYVEDGSVRPFNAIVETPGGYNAVAIRNTGMLEFPMQACVEADFSRGPDRQTHLGSVIQRLYDNGVRRTIQGGAIMTYPYAPSVESVQVFLTTDGRPLNARIELLQGPNNKKQVMELYTEDGRERPFFCILETPGPGNVVRIVNTATVEYPLSAYVEPYLVESGYEEGVPPSQRDDTYFFLDN